jgi:hypothetical protein
MVVLPRMSPSKKARRAGRLSHLRALTNFFRFAAKIGAIGPVPTTDIDISFRRSSVCYLDTKVFADLLVNAYDQYEVDILAWLCWAVSWVAAIRGLPQEIRGNRKRRSIK